MKGGQEDERANEKSECKRENVWSGREKSSH